MDGGCVKYYEIFYSDLQTSAKFKMLEQSTAQDFLSKYETLPKIQYMRMVLETCVYNFRSDIIYSLAKMSREAGDEALVTLYNGCIMLNPTLDADTWSNITHSYNSFKRIEPQFSFPEPHQPMDMPDDLPPTITQTKTEKKKKEEFVIPTSKFINLERHLEEHVIGQREAVHKLTTCLKRAHVQLNDEHRPLGVFLFCGPSGVGKTLIAKELQKYLFENDNFVRIDCGEYQHKHENQKLIGCFAESAQVLTDKGYVAIKDVDIRMSVLTHLGEFKKVICKHVGKNNHPLLRVKSKNANDIVCTKNHEIAMLKVISTEPTAKNIKFVKADNLQVGDILVKPILDKKTKLFDHYAFSEITAIIEEDHSGYIYDLTVEGHSTYTVEGCAVHNSPPGFVGHDDGGQLTKMLMKNPHTVVLLDEAEKAHPDFWHTFLKAFDDGFISDNKGNKVSFKDTIVIITSNLGNDKVSADTYGKSPGFAGSISGTYHTKANPKRDMVERLTEEAVRAFFKPEFLNRIDEIVVFNHLESEDFIKIAYLEMIKVAEKLEKQKYYLEWDEKVLEKLVDLSGKSIEGARGLSKIRREHIENLLADALMQKKHKNGTIFCISIRDDKFEVDWAK